MTIRAASLLLLLLPAAACTKDDPEASLPRISQEGLNTGGFMLDGVAYPATGWSGAFLSTWGGTAALEGGYNIPWPGLAARTDYELRINSERDKKYVTVTLYLRRPQIGEFLLNRNTGLPPAAVDSTIFDHATVNVGGGNGEIYTTSAVHTGRVNMSAATTALSAGTFEFTAVSNLDPSKTVRVTAGRFDRKQ